MGLMGKLEIIGLLSIINHLPSPAKIDNSDTQHNWCCFVGVLEVYSRSSTELRIFDLERSLRIFQDAIF
jgi:hypothetical protein